MKEDISVNIFIPEDGLLVEVSQKKRENVGEYWVVKFGGVVIFPGQEWLRYLASKIAVALPMDERNKISEMIIDANTDDVNLSQQDIIYETEKVRI